MTKQEIVDKVSNATGLTKVETETIMNGVMSTIIDSLANNEKVELTTGISNRFESQNGRYDEEGNIMLTNAILEKCGDLPFF